jgi:hypothetical protein
LGHNCAYDEVRRKSGPKRGYVKALEERLSKYLTDPLMAVRESKWAERLIQFPLEQVETLLKTQDPAVTTAEVSPTNFTAGQGGVSGINLGSVPAPDFNVSNAAIGIVDNADRWGFSGESPQPPLNDLGFGADMNMGIGLDDNTFTWEMIGLGLEEPLPPQETIDELYVMTPFYSLVEKLTLRFQAPNLLRQDPSINANDS